MIELPITPQEYALVVALASLVDATCPVKIIDTEMIDFDDGWYTLRKELRPRTVETIAGRKHKEIPMWVFEQAIFCHATRWEPESVDICEVDAYESLYRAVKSLMCHRYAVEMEGKFENYAETHELPDVDLP